MDPALLALIAFIVLAYGVRFALRRRNGWMFDQVDMSLDLEPVGRGRFAGRYREYDVRVRVEEGRRRDDGEPNRKTYITYEIDAPGLPDGLFIHPEEFSHRLEKLVGRQDIETGDTVFDDAIVVRADDAATVEQLLSHSALRHRMLAACKRFTEFQIRGGVIYGQLQALADADDLDELVDLAEALSAVEPPPPTVTGVDPSLVQR